MTIEAGKAKAAELRQQMQRYACGRRAAKVNRLNVQADAGDTSARATLKAMRIIKQGAPAPSAGELWNPKGKRHVRGKTHKHDTIMRGQRAVQQQGRNI